MKRRVLVAAAGIATALPGLGFGWAQFAPSGQYDTFGFVANWEHRCVVDGRTVTSSTFTARRSPDACDAVADDYWHITVSFPQGGIEYRDVVPPYPDGIRFGDCWPTKTLNQRSSCEP